MDLIGLVASHGYAVVGVVLFLAAIGLPLPVAITLLAIGLSAPAAGQTVTTRIDPSSVAGGGST